MLHWRRVHTAATVLPSRQRLTRVIAREQNDTQGCLTGRDAAVTVARHETPSQTTDHRASPRSAGTVPITCISPSSSPWSPASCVGLVAPDVGKELKPLGTGFVSLIKMMISPIIFCTIVLGVGSVRQAAKVGKVGGLALGYFLDHVDGRARPSAWSSAT